MSVSTVPAVLDALVARTRLALPGVQVLDGGPHRDIDKDAVAIGWSGEDGDEAVTDTRTRQELDSSPDRERYEITSFAWSWRGEETDPKAVRDRAYELVDAVAAVLAGDQRLGGLVNRARLLAVGLVQEQTSKGAVASVRFVIQVDAFTRRAGL